MKLNINAFGLACGILAGVFVAAMTLTNIVWGYPSSWVNLIADIYRWGYHPSSYWAIMIGLIYGFVDGYVFGFLLSWVYNRFTKK